MEYEIFRDLWAEYKKEKRNEENIRSKWEDVIEAVK